MRPIRLKMNAFGPYRGKVDLDFTEFGASSIYLISGPTGSGKTTIFDGISYALYNKASGAIRDVDMLKSQFATEEDFCHVDFTFEMGKVTYRIKRSPKQRAPGARGTPINHQADVELFEEDVSIGQGTMEVDKMIESITGLTHEQFRQIVLLPQGEFRKLLLSSSREKEAIFRDIFGTETIQYFQEQLKAEMKKLKDSYKEYGTRLDQVLLNIEAEDDEILKDAVQKTDYPTIIERLDAQLQKGNKKRTELREELVRLTHLEKRSETLIQLLEEQKQLETQKKELAEKAVEIEKFKEALRLNEQATKVKTESDKLKQLENDKQELTQKVTETKEQLVLVKKELVNLLEQQQASKEAELTLDPIREEIKALEVEITKFENLEKMENEISSLSKAAKESAERIELLESQDAKLEDETKELKINIENVAEWRSELEKTRKHLEETRKQFEQNKAKKQRLEKLIDLQTSLSDYLEEDGILRKQLEKSERAYEEARQHYFGNLAGILVEELVENEPCPVCGSTHHPNPTTVNDNVLTKEKLAEFEKRKDKDQAARVKVATAIEQTASLIDEQKELLGDSTGDYADELALSLQTEVDFSTQISESETIITELEASIQQENEWKKALEEAQTNKNSVQLQLQEVTIAKTTALKKIEEVKEEAQKLQQSLQHASTKEVEAEITEKKTAINAIQEEAKCVQTAISAKEIEQSKLNTSIEHLEAQIASNETNTAEQEELYKHLMAEYELEVDFERFILTSEVSENYMQQIEAFKEEQAYNARQLEKNNEVLQAYENVRSVEELNEERVEIQAQITAAEERRDELNRKTGVLENTHREVKENYEQSQKIWEPLNVYQELSEVANGSTERTNNVSFERYVLSIYFSEILVAANQRFEKMTNGRYELVRKEERAKYGAAAGLDLNIFDRHSGKERPVQSLSGGETFQASLALALGLSDVIQNQQGGVRVDTLFIDEGFGTLDADSLEMAVETLMDLQSNGRMIGIISHVEELKNRIPSRVVVEKQQEGSHAKIEVL